MSKTSQQHRISLAVWIALLPWFAPSLLLGEEPSSDRGTAESAVQIWRGRLDIPEATLRIRLELTPDGDQFTGLMVVPNQGNAQLPIREIRIAGNEFSLALDRPKATYRGKLSDDGKSVSGTWQQGEKTYPLEFHLSESEIEETPSQPKETWKGTLNVGMQLKLQVRLLEDESTKQEVCYFDSLTQGVSGLKANLKRENGQLIVEVPGIEGSFSGKLSEDGSKAVGTWTQGPAKIPLELVKTSEVATAVELKRPQHPKPPYDYLTEEVTFASEEPEVMLAGTLTLPQEQHGEQKFTAAIMISGSGAQDRDESLLGHKPFLVITDHLTKRGIATLRFDDRGTGDSTGDHSTATTADFARDVRGAVAYLQSRSEIDSQRIGLIGHSEGGLIGPLVAANNDDIAFLVLLAGPGVNGRQILLNQVPAMARAAGESEEHVALQKRQLAETLDAIENGASDEQIEVLIGKFVEQLEQQAANDGDEATSPEDMEKLLMSGFKQMNTPWFHYFLNYDPIPTLERTACPILSLIGENDLQVAPKLNADPIARAVRRAGNEQSVCKVLPGLNHLFQECETGLPQEYQTIEQTFAPSALNLISDWVNSLP